MPDAKTVRLAPGMRAELEPVPRPGAPAYVDVKLYLDGSAHPVMRSVTGTDPDEIRRAVLEYLDEATVQTIYALGNLKRNRPKWDRRYYRSAMRDTWKLSGWHVLSVCRPDPAGPYRAHLFGRSSRILLQEDLPADVSTDHDAACRAPAIAERCLTDALARHRRALDLLETSQPF